MSSYELLPCPFCGGEAFLQDDVVNGYTDLDRFCGVSCTDCYAMVDACYETAMEAVQAWNTRAELEAATLGGGRLTAEQVGKAMFRNCVWDENSAMYYVSYTDMQAIADELNAALGGWECVPHGEWESISQTQEVRHVFCECGHELGMDRRDSLLFERTQLFAMPNYCQECGRKIRKAVKR